MADNFFHLSQEMQRAVLEGAASKLKILFKTVFRTQFYRICAVVLLKIFRISIFKLH